MQVVISLLTIASLAIHALIGCCVHHEHAGGVSPDAPWALSHRCAHEHQGHEHARPHGHDTPQPAPHPPHCNESGDFIFVATEKPRLERDHSVEYSLVCDANISVRCHADLTRLILAPIKAHLTTTTTVRAHLMYQVLLI